MTSLVPAAAYRAAYRAQQTAFLFQCLAAHQVLRTLLKLDIQPSPQALREVRRRYARLLREDLDNVEQGLYPRSLLFQLPVAQYAKLFPKMLRDFPRVIRRSQRRDYQDLPPSVRLEHYPPYFRRNFHWQTDGYLSRRSAELYDVGVEFLFLGTADVMRRQIIPPVVRFLRDEPRAQPRVLDVACGTGRTLLQMSSALPDAKLYGLDLSPYYVQVARELCADVADASLVCENAENMPFSDGWFDVVTSVYLFHELPKNARRNVLREMLRVLRPGGLLVLEDSAQYLEGEPVAFFLERFSEEFHEPFHRDYLRDGLGDAVREVGFELLSERPCYVSKIVVARKSENA
jgi:ubiquinone/menaquinone biosynthesis C-methylase UbiE